MGETENRAILTMRGRKGSCTHVPPGVRLASPKAFLKDYRGERAISNHRSKNIQIKAIFVYCNLGKA